MAVSGSGSQPPARRLSAPRSLKARALQWLAQREHSRVELQRKLARAAGADLEARLEPRLEPRLERRLEPDSEAVAAQVAEVLDWLEANGYLSEERFVESRINARAGRYGNLRIRQELQQHALSIPAETAQALGASEIDRARAVRARRFAHLPADAAERAKQARFLIGRGFSSEAVRAALREPAE